MKIVMTAKVYDVSKMSDPRSAETAAREWLEGLGFHVEWVDVEFKGQPGDG